MRGALRPMSTVPAACSWPPLPERFAEALRAAVAFALDEVDAVGVVATGTIVRGTPDASSDLDLYVVHEAPVRRRVQRYFGDGVPTEILVNPPAAVRTYFIEEHARGRPVTAHMLATGHVVLARGPVVPELRSEAAAWLARPSRPGEAATTWARYAAATRLEDATDVAERDPATAAMLRMEAVVAMLQLRCRATTGSVPRGKDLLARVAALDPELGALARRVFAPASAAVAHAAAAEIADRTIGVRGFFEWDSGFGPLPTPRAAE